MKSSKTPAYVPPAKRRAGALNVPVATKKPKGRIMIQSSIQTPFLPNERAELFAAAPTPVGTELQYERNRVELKLFENLNYVLSQVEEQKKEIHALKEQLEGSKENAEAMSAQIEELESRVDELAKPRRSARIHKFVNNRFGRRKCDPR